MIHKTILFFIGIALTANTYADIRPAGISGSGDKRSVIGWVGSGPNYVSVGMKNVWNTSPYNSIVQIRFGDKVRGTGEFVSPRHILTAAHVSAECGLRGNSDCDIYTSDGLILPARVVYYGTTELGSIGTWSAKSNNDWQLLEIVGEYCRPEYRDIDKTSVPMNSLWRAGFGSLRVLNASDIDYIRRAYLAYIKQGGETDSRGMLLNDHDPDYQNKYRVFFQEFKKLSGKDFNDAYNNDFNTLKITQGCEFVNADISENNVVGHTCPCWGGDSGSSIKRMSDNHIVGIHTGRLPYIATRGHDDIINFALRMGNGIPNAFARAAIDAAKRSCKQSIQSETQILNQNMR